MQAVASRLPSYRVMFALLLIALLALTFWTTSRYPSLNEKAMMGGALQLEDPLSFESTIQIDPNASLWERIYLTTYNWIHTNKNGMKFGLLFGAAMLTFIRYLPKKSLQGSYSNSALGLAVGAPLGVCVNCAAPIAKGIYSAGARAEFTLSAMIASPTLNVVVLSMAFAIMPMEVAVAKIVLSLLVILFVVPLVVRLSTPEGMPAQTNTDNCAFENNSLRTESLPVAIFGFAWDFARDLWFIVSRTVPLMLLAGFLGAIVANLVPLENFSALQVTLVTLVLVGAVSLFLPVPIGFDVVAAGALLAAGLPAGLALVAMFALGSFSVYSFMIVGSSIGWKIARRLAAGILIVAVLGGWTVDTITNAKIDNSLAYLTAMQTTE